MKFIKNYKGLIYLFIYSAILSIPDIIYPFMSDAPVLKKIFHAFVNYTFIFSIISILYALLPFKRVSLYLVSTSFLFVPLNVWYIYTYGQRIDSSFMYAMLNANENEIVTYAESYGIVYILAILTIIPFSIFIVKRININNKDRNILGVFGISIFLLVSFSYGSFNSLKISNSIPILVNRTYPFYYIDIYNSYINDYSVDDSIDKNDFKQVSEKSKKNRQIVLLVIGESSRYDHWGVNGYNRQTSPLIIDKIISFDSIYTASGYTSIAVPLILKRSNIENDFIDRNELSIIGLYNQLGYKTIWIGNQSIRGYRVIKSIAQETDVYIDMNVERVRDNSLTTYDESIIKLLDKNIGSSNNNLFVIVHLRGNHGTYETTYPIQFDKYKPSGKEVSIGFTDCSKSKERINSYDNSILYNDYVLDLLIKSINIKDVESSMIFVSDHGENLCDDDKGLTGHGPAFTKYVSHIPYFMYFNELYKNNNPNIVKLTERNISKKGSSSVVTFYTLCGLSGIDFHGYVDSLDMTTSSFNKQKIKSISGNFKDQLKNKGLNKY